MIQVNNVTVILKNVSWSVRKGEHWSILGLNGSGKTTLLNVINGYIWPSQGKVQSIILEKQIYLTETALSTFYRQPVSIQHQQNRTWLALKDFVSYQ